MTGLVSFCFENDAYAEIQPCGSIMVEGHLNLSEYFTAKSIEELVSTGVADRVDDSAKMVMGELYELEQDEVEQVLQLASDLPKPDRLKLINQVNEDLLDAVTADGTGEVCHPAFIKQAIEIWEGLSQSQRNAFEDDAIDHDLLDAIINPEKVKTVRQALGLTD